MELEPTTELTLAVIHWRCCENDKLAVAAERLQAAGAAYLAAEARGAVPPREQRRYTNQLAFAAQNCSCARPYQREQAIEQLSEIETLAQQELRAERDKLKAGTGLAEPKPLDEERYDVKQGLLG